MRQRLNPGDEFAALLQSVRRSSWRWECQGEYAVDMPEVERWQQGLPAVETDEDRAWLTHLANLRADGIPFQRVRMITEPPTDYLRWMVHAIGPNVAAGEDIRWITESYAAKLGAPEYDLYLIDDTTVAVLLFDDHKDLIGVEVDDDPVVVARHQQWRDRVWPVATPHAEYVRQP